jgi:hypothetical protein
MKIRGIAALHAGSVDELRTIEREAVARLNRDPAVARLFLSAPVQALAAAGVTLSSQAVEEWTRLTGFLPSITDDSFALRRRCTALDVQVRIHGLLQPIAAGTPGAGTRTPS